MAVRATAAEVREILDTTLTDAQLDADILAANTVLSYDIEDADCHTTASLTELERWLAAHFATSRELEKTSEKIGPSSASYGKEGAGSRYWDRAVLLDCSGLLKNQGEVPFTAAFIGGAG